MSTETVEEKTVTTPKGSDAFAAARASVAASASTATDDTSTKTPVEDPAKVADPPKEPTENTTDTLELSEEEVGKLSLKDQKVYRALQKKFTETTQQRSALEKQLEPWKPLIDTLSTDPAAALTKLAAEHGFTLAKVSQDTQTVETHTAEAIKELPDELQFLKPHFEAFGKKLIDQVRAEIAPIKETTEHIVSEAAAAETESTLKLFESKHADFKEHEPAMLAWMKRYRPTSKMTDLEYMEDAYKAVTADRTKAEATRKVVDKINKSAESAEPATPGMSSSRVEHVMPPPGKRSIRAAFEAAERGERWVK